MSCARKISWLEDKERWREPWSMATKAKKYSTSVYHHRFERSTIIIHMYLCSYIHTELCTYRVDVSMYNELNLRNCTTKSQILIIYLPNMDMCGNQLKVQIVPHLLYYLIFISVNFPCIYHVYSICLLRKRYISYCCQ